MTELLLKYRDTNRLENKLADLYLFIFSLNSTRKEKRHDIKTGTKVSKCKYCKQFGHRFIYRFYSTTLFRFSCFSCDFLNLQLTCNV